MKNFDKKVAAFKDYLDNISDEELDKIIDEVDKMVIEGPTVEEYFKSLQRPYNISDYTRSGTYFDRRPNSFTP